MIIEKIKICGYFLLDKYFGLYIMKNKWYLCGEELFNILSYGVGILLGIIVGYFFLEKVFVNFYFYWVIGCVLVYLVGMLVLYISLIWYYGFRFGKWKEFLCKFDYGVIYLYIVGIYILFILLVLCYVGGWGWGIFIFVWLLVIVGFILVFKKLKEYSNFEMICFVGMGFVILVVFKLLMDCLFVIGVFFVFWWFFGGGVLYIMGVVFYLL